MVLDLVQISLWPENREIPLVLFIIFQFVSFYGFVFIIGWLVIPESDALDMRTGMRENLLILFCFAEYDNMNHEPEDINVN